MRGPEAFMIAATHAHSPRAALSPSGRPCRIIAASAFAAVVAALAGCGPGEAPAPPPPEVLVVPAAARDVPVITEWLGTTEGSVDADIRAQVAGNLVSRDYQEGQIVKKGDLLFKIDPRPFRAALDEAKGALGRTQAELESARLDVERYTPLVKQGAVSRQEYDNAVQRLRADEAAVQSARANVEKASIDVGFSEIRSPIDGIAGVAHRQLGDFVGPNDPDPVTSVSTLDPIRVSFPVSEQEYLRFASRFQEALQKKNFSEGALELVLADGSVFPYRGTGYPAGREIDPRTGTITVKGVFPNPQQLLRPGQYARLRVETDRLLNAVVVPQRAIQELQGMAQLAVVGAEDKVELRTVVTGPTWGTLRVIQKGVEPGERVVVEGFQKVRPGMVVAPKPAPPELAGAPPPTAPVAAAPNAPVPTPTPTAPPAGGN
jgi:membrane fusion protein, multidrug efflux system